MEPLTANPRLGLPVASMSLMFSNQRMQEPRKTIPYAWRNRGKQVSTRTRQTKIKARRYKQTSLLERISTAAATLKSGRKLRTDMVLLSVGVKPETKLAVESGIAIGETGGIAVNEYMQTNDPDIYALGDAVEVEHPLIHRKMLIPLAGPANKQGRIAADNIVLGNRRRYSGTIGTAIAKIFDLSVAATGLSAKFLKREGIPHLASITHGSSHAGYYPDALPQSVKILFSPDDGKLYGAQIVGYAGVDKRIDVIASLLKSGGTVYDLAEIEHAYAPPFSSAKDPVNIAGFVADNILNGVMKIIHWHELESLEPNGVFLLDVRTPKEFQQGTIHGAVNIPHTELRDRLSELPKDKKIVVFCQVGQRAYVAYRILYQNGFTDLCNLSGGFKTFDYVFDALQHDPERNHLSIREPAAVGI